MENVQEDQKYLDNISKQLEEIEVLTAIFPGENEIIWGDPSLLIDAQDYCHSSQLSVTSKPQSLKFEMNITCNEGSNMALKISFRLPLTYPSEVRPEVVITTDALSRKNISKLQLDMNNYISALELGEPMLLIIIYWLKENADIYCASELHKKEVDKTEKPEELTGMWLYMHHIYSKHKRKDIMNWSHDFDLTGFCLPGKPGIVYLEGYLTNVETFFDKLRVLPWKSIKCRLKETIKERKFSDFQELSFDPHGSRSNHMDFGLFYQFLIEKELGHMFKELFGIEGQSSNN